MPQLARWLQHTLDKEQGDNGGEDYCLDWGFKLGLSSKDELKSL